MYKRQALIKPQFEAGREQIGKKGIVKDKAIHEKVIQKVVDFALDYGFTVKGLDFSPIQGGHGNIEFLAYLVKSQRPEGLAPQTIQEVITKAHKEFEKHEKE